jgi:hypothetical protein
MAASATGASQKPSRATFLRQGRLHASHGFINWREHLIVRLGGERVQLRGIVERLKLVEYGLG